MNTEQRMRMWPYVACRQPDQKVCTHHYCQEDDRRALAARLAAVEATRDRLAAGNTLETHAAEYITDALQLGDTTAAVNQEENTS